MSNRELKAEIILSAGGRFAQVTFIKKNGDERVMLVQPATGKFNVKGEDASPERQEANRKYAENNPHLLRVWDVDREAFRAINLDAVTRIAANGEVYEYELD